MKYTLESLHNKEEHTYLKPEDLKEIRRREYVDKIANEISKTVEITEKDESHFQIKNSAQLIFMPISQWEHVRGMLKILYESSDPAQKDIIRQIVEEIENK